MKGGLGLVKGKRRKKYGHVNVIQGLSGKVTTLTERSASSLETRIGRSVLIPNYKMQWVIKN